MARRSICLVGRTWDKQRAVHRDCGSTEHAHLTRQQADELTASGEAEWLIGTSVLRSRVSAPGSRLSITVGETLAMMVYRGSRIAGQMVREIRDRRRS